MYVCVTCVEIEIMNVFQVLRTTVVVYLCTPHRYTVYIWWYVIRVCTHISMVHIYMYVCMIYVYCEYSTVLLLYL